MNDANFHPFNYLLIRAHWIYKTLEAVGLNISLIRLANLQQTVLSIALNILVDYVTDQLSLWTKKQEVWEREATTPSCSKKPQRKTGMKKLRRVANNVCNVC